MTSPRQTESSTLEVRQFLVSKQGNSLDECEDAIGVDLNRKRFAIADGATEAFDAGNWARQLTKSWTTASGLLTSEQFWEWLENEGKLHHAVWSELELPWYAKTKEQAGSFAAFVGLELDLQDATIRWNAIALGDSCLIHSRRGLVEHAFPVSEAAHFGSAPVLAPSKTQEHDHANVEIATSSGELREGDDLLLLSDAVAAWFLETELKREFTHLIDSGRDEEIARFLDQQRSAERLKNDDIAIVRIRC